MGNLILSEYPPSWLSPPRNIRPGGNTRNEPLHFTPEKKEALE